MKFYELCIRRPVFASVLSLLVVLVGLVCYWRLAVREYPNIDEPVVSVSTRYRGASAEVMESQVTQVLETSIAGIEGIEVLSSNSRAESSNITARFVLGTDPNVAASDIRDRVSRVRNRLPDEVDEPVIAKVEADAQPILYVAFTSDRHSPKEISDFADRYVKDRLQNLPGVAEARIFGERRYAMRIWVDRYRLAAYDLTVQDVESALRRQNVEVPAGRIESTDREFTVLSRTNLTTPEEFRRVIVKDANRFPVRLGDVATVELGTSDVRRATRYRGQNAVSIGIVKQATANPLEVSQAIRAELPHVLADLPDGMSANVAYDTSIFIERSIANVFRTVAEAVGLVVLVIFFFLRSFRATLIPLVTIPVSLVGACALMFVLGFTINTLTLLALVLAIGLVVDDAIVVLENIHRHVEEGLTPFKAAIKGTGEIAFAVIAMTLTLTAVFTPVAFATGRTGRLFSEFALALAGAVLVSGFVALTLSPMMCSKLLRGHQRHSAVYNVLESGFRGLSTGYRAALRASLAVRPVIVAVAVAVAFGGYWFFTQIKSELTPTEDRGTALVIGIGPEGSTIESTSRYVQQFEELIAQIPEVAGYFSVAGFPEVTTAAAFMQMKPWEERTRKQQEVIAELQPKLGRIAGVLAFANNPPSLGQSPRDKPVVFVVQTSGSYRELEGLIEKLMVEARKYPGFINLDTDLRLNKPQVEIGVNRDKAADVGVDIETIGRTLETLLGGRQVTEFKRNDKQYDVVVQVQDVDRRTPAMVNDIWVRGRGDAMVALSNLVTISETVSPKDLNRFNQMRAANISAHLAPGYTLGDGLAYLDAAAARILPASARTDYSGQSREFRQSSSSIYFIFVLALFFIYLVLAAQFESFVDPFIIMVTVPLSMLGGLYALHATGGTLNIYSQIGLITLVGLITKHGILIVDFANKLRDEGVPLKEAVIESATLRLRPILMTTGAMVLGALPLAYAAGAGAESRQQIGWVIVGGMTLGTLLTLFVVPTVYTLVARRHRAAGAPGAAPAPAPAE